MLTLWLLAAASLLIVAVIVYLRLKKDHQQQVAILVFSCVIMFGSACNYDFPSAVSKQMQNYWNLDQDTFLYRFNLLYSIYSLPNIVLPIYAGNFIARVGFNQALVILLTTVFTGILVYAIGLSMSDQNGTGYSVLILGRLLLGLGSETLLIVQSSLLTKYFLGTQPKLFSLSFAMAIALSVGRLNSVLDYTFLPKISQLLTMQGCAWLIVGISGLSVVGGLIISYLNRHQQQPLSQDEEVSIKDSFIPEDQVTIMSSKKQSTLIVETATAISSPRKRPQSHNTSSQSLLAEPESLAPRYSKDDDDKLWVWKLPVFSLVGKLLPDHILRFPVNYWYTIFIVLCLSTATISFLPMATPFLEAKYFYMVQNSDGSQASSLVSIPDTLSVISMPIFAFLSDRDPSASVTAAYALVHRQLAKVNQLIMSGLMIALAHFLFLTSDVDPSIILLILGAGYASFGSVIYSLMAETIQASSWKQVATLPKSQSFEREQLLSPRSEHDSHVASAYGLATCLVNATFFTTPLVVAWLMSITYRKHEPNMYNRDYDSMLIFYMMLALMGTFFSIAMRRVLVKEMRNLTT